MWRKIPCEMSTTINRWDSKNESFKRISKKEQEEQYQECFHPRGLVFTFFYSNLSYFLSLIVQLVLLYIAYDKLWFRHSNGTIIYFYPGGKGEGPVNRGTR